MKHEPPDELRLGLAERLGGPTVIRTIVDGLYDRLQRDPTLQRLFRSERAHEREGLTWFFIELFGGPAEYTGRARADTGMQRRHGHRVITLDEAHRWLDHLETAMAEVGVAAEVAEDVLAVLRGPAERLVNPGGTGKEIRAAVAAAGKGDLVAVQAMVAEQPEMLGQAANDGMTMLWAAAARGRLEVVQWLLAEGAPRDKRGSSVHATSVMVTPYAAALAARKTSTAEELAGAGAELDVFDLAFLGRTDAVAALLDADAEAVHRPCPDDELYPVTPLHYAVDAGHLDTAQLLIGRGAVVEPYSRRLLAAAARRASLPLIELLLANGADATQAEHLGPVDLDPSIARALVAHGLDINRPPRNRESFLTMACRGDKGKRIETVEALLALGADPTSPRRLRSHGRRDGRAQRLQ